MCKHLQLIMFLVLYASSAYAFAMQIHKVVVETNTHRFSLFYGAPANNKLALMELIASDLEIALQDFSLDQNNHIILNSRLDCNLIADTIENLIMTQLFVLQTFGPGHGNDVECAWEILNATNAPDIISWLKEKRLLINVMVHKEAIKSILPLCYSLYDMGRASPLLFNTIKDAPSKFYSFLNDYETKQQEEQEVINFIVEKIKKSWRKIIYNYSMRSEPYGNGEPHIIDHPMLIYLTDNDPVFEQEIRTQLKQGNKWVRSCMLQLIRDSGRRNPNTDSSKLIQNLLKEGELNTEECRQYINNEFKDPALNNLIFGALINNPKLSTILTAAAFITCLGLVHLINWYCSIEDIQESSVDTSDKKDLD